VVRMSSLGSAVSGDVMSDHPPPETKMGRPGDSELTNQPQRVVDMQLGNVPSRCAWLAETLSSSSHIVEEQVSKHLIQLASDLEKVATYVSGALQLQLESKTEVVSLLERQLEHITKVLLPPPGQASSGISTVVSTPLLQPNNQVRSPVLPGVVRMRSGEDRLKKAYVNTPPPPIVRPPTAFSPGPPRTSSPALERAEERTLLRGPMTYSMPFISPPNQQIRSPSPPRRPPSHPSTPQPPMFKSVISVYPQPQMFPTGGSATLPMRGRSKSPTTQPPPVPISHGLSSSLRNISRSTWSPTSATGTIQRGGSHETASMTGGGWIYRQSSNAGIPAGVASAGQEASVQAGGSLLLSVPPATTSPGSKSVSAASVSAASLNAPANPANAAANHDPGIGSGTSAPAPAASQSAAQGSGPSQSPSLQEKIQRPRSRMSIVEARLDAMELNATLSKELSKAAQS